MKEYNQIFINRTQGNSVDGYKIAMVLIMLGNLLFGASHISMLPAWEGFDEIAHYSSIAQIADTGTMPRQKISSISKDVEAYGRYAPMPYSANPPMQRNRGMTYKSFFEETDEIQKRGFSEAHSKPDLAHSFAPGHEKNWQSQHPPLLYSILVPVYQLTQNFSWIDQLWVLRMSCYLLVWLAMIVGIICCEKISHFSCYRLKMWTVAGILIWPFAFVSWFPSMARLGNDSLCTLIAALVWWWVVKIGKDEPNLKHATGLGVLLGLGCLTKAFFVPISAGMVLYWSYRLWLNAGRSLDFRIFSHMLTIISMVGLISGWWYIQNWLNYGVLLGSLEMIQLRDEGGLSAGFYANFSVIEWLRGHVVFIRTLAWVGTWSWARPENVWLFPVFLTPFLVAWYSILAVRKFPSSSLYWLPIWWLIPVLCGFSYHVLVRVLSDGVGTGTSGYFLNMLVVPLGIVFGLSLQQIWRTQFIRRCFIGLFAYGILLAVYTSWAQTMLFAGILFKQGNSRTYLFPDSLPPLFGIPEAIDRMQLISNPGLSLILWFLAAAFTVPGLSILFRQFYHSTKNE